ncbi:MAG: HlyD family secretion protein [Sphingomonadales bacterium]|nr:HlyD family secretion protein [Sphingomonadales bacterium]
MADRDPEIRTEGASPMQAEPPAGLVKKNRWLRPVLMSSLPLALLIGGSLWYVANDHYVSTDNAYIQQDKMSVSAEVSGRITQVLVKENQPVRAGQLLFIIDAEPFRLAAAQADASMAGAQAKIVGLETELSTSGVDINSAQEDVAFFEKEYHRQSALMQRGFTTKARLQAAEHALSEARSKLANARADALKARAALATGTAVPGVNPAVASARVQKEKALLDLSKTQVRAPADGIVSQSDRLQVGQMMVTGLPALSIVTSGKGWVEANFKETDLGVIRVGQPAEVKFDAYPDLKLRGHVSSIGAGTGSEFSVLPAQNANGNWVKVTQRVPVRIAIDDKPPRAMIAGLSAKVRIDTAADGKR